MSKATAPDRPRMRFVGHLPDLITLEDYLDPSDKKKIRIQITVTEKGIEILGDSMYPLVLEELLARAGAEEIEGMLCG